MLAASRERDSRQQHDEQEESEWACSKSQKREAREHPSPVPLQRPQRQQRQGHPQHERIRGRDDEQRPDQRERPDRPAAVRLPLVPHDSGECDHCDGHGEDREEFDPDRGRQGVVQEAVVHEAVAARVPEVVPEHEAVLDEQRALVDVGGEIGSRRAEPDQERRE